MKKYLNLSLHGNNSDSMYKKFQTKNANYWLECLGYHLDHSKPDCREFGEDVDALVIESGPRPESVYDESLKKRIPIYIVDVGVTVPRINHPGKNAELPLDALIPLFILALSASSLSRGIRGAKNMIKTGKKIGRRDFLKGIAGVGACLLAISPWEFFMKSIASSGEYKGIGDDYWSAVTHIAPVPAIEGRNAVNARKIEEWVVPRLAEELGRKPNICLFYGNAHAGLEEDLKHKRLRDSILGLYAKFDYPGLNKNELNIIKEFFYYSKIETPAGPVYFFDEKIHKVDLFDL
jgi:hypothetical protein